MVVFECYRCEIAWKKTVKFETTVPSVLLGRLETCGFRSAGPGQSWDRAPTTPTVYYRFTVVGSRKFDKVGQCWRKSEKAEEGREGRESSRFFFEIGEHLEKSRETCGFRSAGPEPP